MKAMILAAGRGERLRPLTERVPKALVLAGGQPLIVYHLIRLAAAGIREVVVNTSHLGQKIIARLGSGSEWGLSITYSQEPAPLETAGGIAQARAYLGADPFLLVNADIYTDIDFSHLRAHALGNDCAHLVLVQNPAHRPDGDFSLAGERVGNDASPRYTYAGVAVLVPALVQEVGAGEKAPLGPILHSVAAKGLVSGELHAGAWHDVGTSERLAALEAVLGTQRSDGHHQQAGARKA